MVSLSSSYIDAPEPHPKERRSQSNPSLNPTAESLSQNKKTSTPSPSYPNSTFGSAQRLQLPKIERRQDFYQHRSEMNKLYGSFSKAPRAPNLNVAGKDSPNPSKYNLK
mgnify:CR=1 FL=1